MEHVIEIRSLRKEYKEFALKDISFDVPKGFITGLIGPNGAGKTTIIKLLMNLVRRRNGTITIFGLDNIEDEVQIKDRIGFVYDSPYFYEDLSLSAIKGMIAPFYSQWDEQQFQKLMTRFDLPKNKAFSSLSKGMKTKFALVLALSHNADLIILDEPTAGLDPVFRREFLEMLGEIMLDAEKSVLFSTHITSDLDRIGDYMIFVRNGEIVLTTSKVEVQERWGLVKSRSNFITAETQNIIRGYRAREYGFEALTTDLPKLRGVLSADALVERPTIEDIIFFLDKGESHA